MPLEAGDGFISGLVATNPVGASDPKSQGDDHLRLIKTAVKGTFPNLTGAVTPTQTAINQTCVGTGGTFPAINGSNLTALNATALASGTVADARLSTNVPLLNADNTFSQSGSQNVQAWQTTSADDVYHRFTTNSAGRGYFGSPGANGNLIGGSLVGDMLLRMDSGRFLISSNDGASVCANFSNAEVDLTATLLDFNGNVDISGTLIIGGALTGSHFLANGGGGGGFSWFDDTDTSVVRGAANRVDIVAGGATIAQFSGAEVDLTATLLDFNGNADISGTLAVGGVLTTPNADAAEVGFKGTPLNTQNGNYTLVLADTGKMIYKASGAGNTITIPANASVAFPIGTHIVIMNDSGNSVSVAITSDVLVNSAGATGTRTVADQQFVELRKVTATRWRIIGPTT